MRSSDSSPEVRAQLLLMGKEITSQVYDALAVSPNCVWSCSTLCSQNGFPESTRGPRGRWVTTPIGGVTGTFLDVNWPAGVLGLSVSHVLYIVHSAALLL